MMSRKSPARAPFSVFGPLADWLARPRTTRPATAGGRSSGRRLGYESLEGRVVLSGVPLAVIQGTVTNSSTAAGQSGVAILLTPTNPAGAPQSTTTNASGLYSFTGLAAGTYTVQETPPTGFTAPTPNPQTVVITSSDTIAGNIDTFTTPQTVTASSAGPTSAASSIAASEALGGNRDITSQIVSGTGTFTVAANEFGTAGLQFNSTVAADGNGTVAWDGPNSGNPSVINPTGLDHADLTVGGAATGILINIGGDHPNSSITINIFTDAGDWSTATDQIPNTGGGSTQATFIPFSAFTTGAGAGATFSNVGAVQIQISGGVNAANGQISLVAEDGPTVESASFANTPQADLQITKIDNVGGSSITAAQGTATPGNPIQYTIVVTNAGPAAASGATIADPFPAALTGVTWTASATQGSPTGFTSSGSGYIDDTNVDMPALSQITYTVHATVSPTVTGTLTNVATVTPPEGTTDPTPTNNTATDVDILAPQADLSITKVDNVGGSSITSSHGSVSPGGSLTYTIVVSNGGPSAVVDATVSDPMPGSLTGVTYTATQTGGASGFTASGSGSIDDTVVDMPVGSTITYTVHATVSSSATGTLTNVATVSEPEGTTDPTPTNNTATDIDSIVPVADLSVTKVDNVGGSSITSADMARPSPAAR